MTRKHLFICLGFLAALWPQKAQAQQVFNVLNTSDAGAGSFPQAIAGANGVAGSTIAWSGSTSGDTISLTNPLAGGINGDTILDVSGASSSVTIAGPNAVPLNGPVTFTNNSLQISTISANITDGTSTGSLIKAGIGTLALTGTNTYSGGTVLNAGVLNFNNNNALGTGAITFNGGTLQAGAPILSLGNAINITTTGGTFDTQSSTTSLTGLIGGAGALTVIGNGTVNLSAGNTYSGGTFLNGGLVNITNDSALGAASSTATFSGGILQTGVSLSTNRYFTLNGNGGTFDTQGNTINLNGVISGEGNLTILGTPTGGGTVNLTNPFNTYSGDTIISSATVIVSTDEALGTGPLEFNNGTLQLGTNITDTREVVINALGATFNTAGSSSTFSGLFEGAGALTKIGANTLYLTGSNSFVGTNINQGTININNNDALGSYGITFNGGTLQAGGATIGLINTILINGGGGTIDSSGNLVRLAGVISGTGSLTIMSTMADSATVISTGTVYLTQANTYTGGTFLNSGILNITADSELGVSTTTLTFNGGILQSGEGFASGRNMVIGTSSATIDTNYTNVLLSGVISGGGAGVGLSKIGQGILTLAGNNTYAGGTSVNAGTLQLGATGALPSGGDIIVNPGAIFDMQNYQQTVGNYNPTGGGGTLNMILQPAFTNLHVTGNANITNDTLSVNFTPATALTLVNGLTTFTPITAGSFTGAKFANLVTPAAFAFAQNVVGNNLVLTTQFVPFAASAANPNQSAIANSMEPLRTLPTGDVATVIGDLYTLSPTQLQGALDQIGPLSLASMQSLSQSGSTVQSAAVSQRMAALADGKNHGGISSYALNARSNGPGDLLAEAGDADVRYWNSNSNSPWGFFTSGVATVGRLQEANGSSGMQPGYAFNTGGLTGGADYAINDNLAAGASFGYLHGHASIYTPASGTVDNSSARYGVYVTAFDENFRANLYLGGAADFFTTNRGINFPGIYRTATANPHGNEFNAHPDVIYDIPTIQWGTFSPFAGLNYNRLNVGSFSESGADSLDLSVSPQTAQSLESSLGLKYSQKFNGAFDDEPYHWTPYGSLGWRHEFINQSRPIDAQLAAGGATQFSVNTGTYARDGTLVGLGCAWDWERTTAKLDYLGDFRSHYQDHSFNISVRWKF